MDGRDDLLGVDALEVDRCRSEVRTTELVLDDVQQDALPCELKAVGVAQLMWREPASYTASGLTYDELPTPAPQPEIALAA